MGYYEALEAAGAEVLAFEQFGSYQGDWWAKVNYNGRQFWIHGTYGSCSGCDSFEAEFGWSEDQCEDHKYKPKDEHFDCAACQEAVKEYTAKLANFGRGYLESGDMSQAEAEKEAGRNAEWDSDAPHMVTFLQNNKLKD